MADRIIYFDNNATTKTAPEVVETMIPFLKEEFYNPSSAYDAARGPRDAIRRAREWASRIVGAGSRTEMIFTASGTEGNNAALWGTLRANPGRRHIVTTAVEHPAVIEVAREIERSGYDVTILPVDGDGQLDTRDLIRAIRPDTALVSIMHANNETGVIFPLAKLAGVVKGTDPNIVFHTDATQTVGKMPIDLNHALKDVDILTFSGHKLHAPKGVGAMFVRRGTRWRPYLLGGHQERGRRAGTENVASIVGLGKACDLAAHNMVEEERLRKLHRQLEETVKAQIPNVFINGEGAPRLPNTTNVAFEFVEGEGILFALSEYGVCASSGSACTSGSLDPSHVLKAMNIPFTAAHGSLRLSSSRYNTKKDFQAVAEALPPIISSLRRMSPYWDQAKNAPKKGVEVFVQEKYRETT